MKYLLAGKSPPVSDTHFAHQSFMRLHRIINVNGRNTQKRRKRRKTRVAVGSTTFGLSAASVVNHNAVLIVHHQPVTALC